MQQRYKKPRRGRQGLGKIVHKEDIKHYQPMKYVGSGGLHRIIVCRGMEGGERHGHDDPVLIGIDPVDQNDDHSDKQVKEEQAPAFPDLDEEFAEILLDKVSAYNKRDDEPGHSEGDPDGFGEGGNVKNDLWNEICPGPVSGQVEDQKEKIIGKSEPKQADQPFADAERTHGQQPEQHKQEEGDRGDIQQGNNPGPDTYIEDGRAGPWAVV
jgi:hypothetical protein